MTNYEKPTRVTFVLSNWLKAVGMTQREAADIIGRKEAALSKIIRKDSTLMPDNAQMLWQAFGFPYSDWNKLYKDEPDPTYFAQHGIEWKGKNKPEYAGLQVMNFRTIPVIGEVQAGVFTEAMEWPKAEQYNVTVPENDGHPKSLPRFGLLVKGESMNKAFQEGTIIINIPFDRLGRDPKDGDCVVVQRTNQYGPGMECTVKVLKIMPDGELQLWPKSTSPDFTKPIIIKPNGGENQEQIKIISLVVSATIAIGKMDI